MKNRICEYCGAALDYGERCDCREDELWAEEIISLEERRNTDASRRPNIAREQ